MESVVSVVEQQCFRFGTALQSRSLKGGVQCCFMHSECYTVKELDSHAKHGQSFKKTIWTHNRVFLCQNLTSGSYKFRRVFSIMAQQGPVRRWICTSFNTERWSGPSYKRSQSWFRTADGKWKSIKCLCFVRDRCASARHSLAPPTARLQELGFFQRES